MPFAQSLIGIVLTGANADGAQGLKAIKARGGLAIVQDPQTAQATAMPRAALEATPVDYLVDLQRDCTPAHTDRHDAGGGLWHSQLSSMLTGLRRAVPGRDARPNILIVDDRKENLLATEKVLRHLDAGIFKRQFGQ